MFLKRLTLACEATFWVFLMAAVGAPQLPKPMALTARPTAAQTADARSFGSVEEDSATAGERPETLLEQLVARYESYREVRMP